MNATSNTAWAQNRRASRRSPRTCEIARESLVHQPSPASSSETTSVGSSDRRAYTAMHAEQRAAGDQRDLGTGRRDGRAGDGRADRERGREDDVEDAVAATQVLRVGQRGGHGGADQRARDERGDAGDRGEDHDGDDAAAEQRHAAEGEGLEHVEHR